MQMKIWSEVKFGDSENPENYANASFRWGRTKDTNLSHQFKLYVKRIFQLNSIEIFLSSLRSPNWILTQFCVKKFRLRFCSVSSELFLLSKWITGSMFGENGSVSRPFFPRSGKIPTVHGRRNLRQRRRHTAAVEARLRSSNSAQLLDWYNLFYGICFSPSCRLPFAMGYVSLLLTLSIIPQTFEYRLNIHFEELLTWMEKVIFRFFSLTPGSFQPCRASLFSAFLFVTNSTETGCNKSFCTLLPANICA